MKRLLILVALLVLTVSSAAAFEPNSPAVVPDSPEVVPDSPEFEPNNEVVPDSPDIAWGGPTMNASGCPDPKNCTPPLSAEEGIASPILFRHGAVTIEDGDIANPIGTKPNKAGVAAKRAVSAEHVIISPPTLPDSAPGDVQPAEQISVNF